MNTLESFLETITETRKVWLLEAMTGMFAMLEDADGNSYIPVWDAEEKARKAAVGDWSGYEVTEMGFSELILWLKELSHDEIDIAVAPEKDGEIIAISSSKFRTWLKPMDDNSYHEEPEEGEEDSSSGPDDFDYGEGWAEKW